MPDNKNRFAIFNGPILLAGDIGSIDKPIAAPFDAVSNDKISLPYFVVDSSFERSHPLLTSRGIFSELPTTATRPQPTTFVPFFNATGRYTVYFDIFTEEEWQEREAEYKAEQARLQEIERLTVDFFQPGEMQPERDHNFRGVNTSFGEAFGRKWRHATGGGSMTFEMQVNPDTTNKLVFTYWGSDSGNRLFDILIDGKKIAEQRLDHNAPEKFFDVAHLLDDEAFRGKERITVTLQAKPGAWAGGIFGVRTVIVEE